MARIVRLIRLGKVLNLLRKIEERFVMVRLTAFKLLSIVGFTFIMAHLFGCLFIFFAAVDDVNYYANSWVFSSGQSVHSTLSEASSVFWLLPRIYVGVDSSSLR